MNGTEEKVIEKLRENITELTAEQRVLANELKNVATNMGDAVGRIEGAVVKIADTTTEHGKAIESLKTENAIEARAAGRWSGGIISGIISIIVGFFFLILDLIGKVWPHHTP